MRILFAAYCMVDNENGDTLIGVYKRATRIGKEMARRGHEIWMLCPGRRSFHDDLTEWAAEQFYFLDLPARLMSASPLDVRRRYYRRIFHQLELDMVVVGEAPMAGELLECAIAAAVLGIRSVVLDNAYNAGFACNFIASHGPMLDGIVLSGPSSFQPPKPPSYYCAAPPYVEGDPAKAQSLLKSLGIESKKLITVLGYEAKAERLAAALIPWLVHQESCAAIFLVREPQKTRENLNTLAPGILRHLHVLPLPDESLLFGILSLSNLVIGKCGFMQATESLALGSAFLGIQYRGCFPLAFLPGHVSRFVHATTEAVSTPPARRAALRLLRTPSRRLRHVHDGRFGGSSAVADFLERLPPAQRAETTAECALLGYSGELFLQVLSRRHPHHEIRIGMIRCTRLRDTGWGHIDTVVCRYVVQGRQKALVLWGRRYYIISFAKKCLEAAASSASRQIIFVSPDYRLILEEDAGESMLPPIQFHDTRLRAATRYLRRLMQRPPRES